MPDKNVSHNNQKKIAAINDYSGFGRCSIAVELPVISAMKIQCCPSLHRYFLIIQVLTAFILKISQRICRLIWQSGRS